MGTALITCMHLARHFEKFRPQYEQHGITAIVPTLEGQMFTAAEMAELIIGVDAVIAGDDEIDAHVLDAGKASCLKAVIKWGIGTDGIDKPHATKIDIPVYNTPGVFSDEVADLAISHLLMLLRKTHLMHASVAEGGWFKSEGHSLRGMTAGIVGLGSIGQGVVQRVKAFGMEALGFDVQELSADTQKKLDIEQTSLETLLEKSDVVFVACALTDSNHHLINSNAFASMKDGSYLINVARGPLVDEAALVTALQENKISGAGLDVFEVEPLPMTSALRQFGDRCTFSTHNGSNTIEAVERINQRTSEILFDVLGKKSITHFTPNKVA